MTNLNNNVKLRFFCVNLWSGNTTNVYNITIYRSSFFRTIFLEMCTNIIMKMNRMICITNGRKRLHLCYYVLTYGHFQVMSMIILLYHNNWYFVTKTNISLSYNRSWLTNISVSKRKIIHRILVILVDIFVSFKTTDK